ncbi:MAG: hypothetical protein DRJ05_05410 [Bacteroidetes bacterium]|nr:MAG: hypothetical protein DRJ05_05410 [Bacteroidota bacterium]
MERSGMAIETNNFIEYLRDKDKAQSVFRKIFFKRITGLTLKQPTLFKLHIPSGKLIKFDITSFFKGVIN